MYLFFYIALTFHTAYLWYFLDFLYFFVLQLYTLYSLFYIFFAIALIFVFLFTICLSFFCFFFVFCIFLSFSSLHLIMALYTFGSNLGSQLAHSSDFDDTHIPTKILHYENIQNNNTRDISTKDISKKSTINNNLQSKDIQKVACGSMHTLLLINSIVYSYGCDDEAALGRKGPEHEIIEVKIKDEVVDIACGASHSIALTKKGAVYGWGTFRDQGGVIGFNTKTKFQRTPYKIATNITKVVSCDNYVCMVSKSGSLLCYGPDLYKSNRAVSTKRKAIDPRKMCLKTRLVMRKTKKMPKIDKLCGGANHVMFISDNKVYGYGNNNCGQMGINEKGNFRDIKDLNIHDVVDCDGAVTHSLFLKKNGDLYASGSNTYGNIGNESVGKETLVPVKVTDNVTMMACAGSMNIIVRNNELYGFGSNFYGELGCKQEKVSLPRKIEYGFGEILSVKVGCNHTVVLTKDNNME